MTEQAAGITILSCYLAFGQAVVSTTAAPALMSELHINIVSRTFEHCTLCQKVTTCTP